MSNIFKNKRAIQIWGICAAAVSVLSVVLRTLSILFFYDRDIGYYKAGAILPVIAQVLPLLAVAVALIFVIVPSLRPQVDTSTDGTKISSGAIFPAVGFSAYAVLYAVTVIGASYFDARELMLPIAIAVCLVLGAIYFWLTAFEKKLGTWLYVLSGLGAILSLAYFLTSSHFDNAVQINAPNKTVFHLAIIFSMLFVVCEMRNGLPQRKPFFHLFGATATVIFALTSSVPSILCYFLGKMPYSYSLFYEDGVLLFLAIYAGLWLFNTCRQRTDTFTADPQEQFSQEAL